MFRPIFWLESSTDILCVAYQGSQMSYTHKIYSEVVINKD